MPAISGSERIGTVEKGTVPTRGRPGRDLRQDRSQREKREAPSSPFFRFSKPDLLPKLSRAAASGRREEKDDVRADAKTAAEARLARGRAGACRGDRRRGDRAQSRRRRRGPIACAMPRRFSPQPRDPSCRRFLIFERTDGAPAAGRLVRPRPTAVGRGRARLLDRAGHSGAAASPPKPAGAGRYRPQRSACAGSKPRTSSTIPPPARVLEKLGFEPLGIVAPRISCARGDRSAGAADAAGAGERKRSSA